MLAVAETSFYALFDSVGTVELAESDEVITVLPRVTPRPQGGFLVTDAPEQQVRLYGPDGRLTAAHGKKGDGPGEFRLPVSARPGPDSTVYVTDRAARRITVFSSDLDSVLATWSAPLSPLYDAVHLPGLDLLLLAGGLPESGNSLLHLWDPARREVLRSFFPRPGDREAQTLAMSIGGVRILVRADEILAVSSLVDTMYVFGFDGTERHRFPLPLAGFDQQPSFEELERAPPRERMKLLEGLVQITDLFDSGEGVVVQAATLSPSRSVFAQLEVDSLGAASWLTRDAPHLMAVADGRYYFADASRVVANKWTVYGRRRE